MKEMCYIYMHVCMVFVLPMLLFFFGSIRCRVEVCSSQWIFLFVFLVCFCSFDFPCRFLYVSSRLVFFVLPFVYRCVIKEML